MAARSIRPYVLMFIIAIVSIGILSYLLDEEEKLPESLANLKLVRVVEGDEAQAIVNLSIIWKTSVCRAVWKERVSENGSAPAAFLGRTRQKYIVLFARDSTTRIVSVRVVSLTTMILNPVSVAT